MKRLSVLGSLIIVELLIMLNFYDVNERLDFFWSIVFVLVVLNILLAVFWFVKRKIAVSKLRIAISTSIYTIILVCIFTFSFYQFNYVVMPYEFFDNDEIFYAHYDYEDLYDDVRIEYYARDYYGEDEIYHESYDKDEIQYFLEMFRDIEPISEEEFEMSEYQNVFLDWHNDIHVMIRNMDDSELEEGGSGYYVFSINLVDTSIYAEIGNGEVYLVTSELRQFIINHLY